MAERIPVGDTDEMILVSRRDLALALQGVGFDDPNPEEIAATERLEALLNDGDAEEVDPWVQDELDRMD